MSIFSVAIIVVVAVVLLIGHKEVFAVGRAA